MDDYDISINSNMLSIKSPTVKHINNNDATLLNHNTLNAPAKCNKNTITMLPTTSTSQSQNANFLLATNNTNSCNISNGNISTHINSNEALHSRLTFTSPKLVNSRGAAMAIDCYESDTVDNSMIKEEPLSPDSSCPPSPIASTASTSTANILDGTSHIIVTQPANQTANANSQFGTINVNLANVATYTNTDLVFEHNKVSLKHLDLMTIFIYIYGHRPMTIKSRNRNVSHEFH